MLLFKWYTCVIVFKVFVKLKRNGADVSRLLTSMGRLFNWQLADFPSTDFSDFLRYWKRTIVDLTKPREVLTHLIGVDHKLAEIVAFLEGEKMGEVGAYLATLPEMGTIVDELKDGGVAPRKIWKALRDWLDFSQNFKMPETDVFPVTMYSYSRTQMSNIIRKSTDCQFP